MKIKRHMFQQKLAEIPVTFQDVAACFSEEEWKLLHEWQKELYKNVMKEIHQAMIALGPLIATSVFALGPKEKEYLYDVDHQEDETGNDINQNTGDTTGNYEVSFGINLEEDLYEDNPVETDRQTCANHPSTAGTVHHPLHIENVPQAEQCCKSILVDHQNAEAERGICHNIGHMDIMSNLSLAIKEETTTYTKFHQRPDGRGNSMTLRNTGVSFGEHPTQDQREVSTVASSAVAQIVTFPLKEDDPSRFMDSLDSEIQENIRRPTEAGGQGNRTKKHSRSAHSDQMPPCTAFHGNSKSDVLQSPSKIPNCRWQWWSETNQELRGEKNIQIESAFSASVDSHAHLEAPTLMGPDKCNEDSENLSSAIHQTDQPTTKQISRSYNSTEYEKRLRQTKDLFKHRRTYNCLYAKIPPKFTTLKPVRNALMYQCYYCAKKFNHKGHFTTHIRTHTKERPFPCNECEKSFNTKGNLNSHKRMHTGERPYHCTQCEKNFSQQGHLSRHYKSHHLVQNTSD